MRQEKNTIKGEGGRGKEREGLRIKNHLCNACSFTFSVIN